MNKVNPFIDSMLSSINVRTAQQYKSILTDFATYLDRHEVT